MQDQGIFFPNLGIGFEHVNKSVLAMGKVEIRFFGLILGAAILLGFLATSLRAKRTGQDPEDYLDLAVYLVVFGVIGARLYYMFFRWQDQFKSMVPTIFDMKEGGGLCLYGAIIAGMVTVLVYSIIKRKNALQILDTLVFGLTVGIAGGRVSDFFERANFGGYSDGLFAMRVSASDVIPATISEQMTEAALINEYRGFIQVEPLFVYDILFNILFLIFALIFARKIKRQGNLFFIYMILYFAFRAYIDGMVSAPLVVLETSLPVNQFIAVCLFLLNLIAIVTMNLHRKNGYKHKI